MKLREDIPDRCTLCGGSFEKDGKRVILTARQIGEINQVIKGGEK